MQTEYSDDQLPSSWAQYNQTVRHRYILFVFMVSLVFFRLSGRLSIFWALGCTVVVLTHRGCVLINLTVWKDCTLFFIVISSIFVVSLWSAKPKSCCSSLSCSSSLISVSYNIVLPGLFSSCISTCAFYLLVGIAFSKRLLEWRASSLQIQFTVSALWHCLILFSCHIFSADKILYCSILSLSLLNCIGDFREEPLW